MKSRRKHAAVPKGGKAILVRLRDRDTPYGVTHRTLRKLAETMDLKVSDVVHVALAECAKANLPRYEIDDGALTRAQHKAIARLTRKSRATYRETDSLFGGAGARGDHDGRNGVRSASRSR